MRPLRFIAWLGIIASLTSASFGGERNAWPFLVSQSSAQTAFDDDAPVESRSGLGPLLFSQPFTSTRQPADPAKTPSTSLGHASGLRPFYVRLENADHTTKEVYVLYPIFSYHSDYRGRRWSFFSLINQEDRKVIDAHNAERAIATERDSFEVWPFYLSRETGRPETSYHAVFPIYGSVTRRFGQDRWTWVLFPLYGRFEKRGAVTTTAPWPFIKHLQGNGHHGFEIWPLYGSQEKAGDYRHQYLLWPLVYRSATHLDEPQPDTKEGILPFYARSRSASGSSATYLFPFFGYSERTAPYHYRETHYFWPLLVQGKGDHRTVNRWAPFYTHSVNKDVDKTWLLWPVWRHQTSVEGKLAQTKNQFLYFLYNSTTQRSLSHPELPAAHKTHLWPFVTVWDNGAGRSQVQALSPLEVFFPHNEKMRLIYSPLFALYRHDQTAPGHTSGSVLWKLISWQRRPESSAFHLGPLFNTTRQPTQRRYSLASGLLNLTRDATGHWTFTACDFSRRHDTPQSAALSAPATP